MAIPKNFENFRHLNIAVIILNVVCVQNDAETLVNRADSDQNAPRV